MSRWKLGSMVSKWVMLVNGFDQWAISPTYKWGIPWGYNPLILTIDPNFLGNLSMPGGFCKTRVDIWPWPSNSFGPFMNLPIQTIL